MPAEKFYCMDPLIHFKRGTWFKTGFVVFSRAGIWHTMQLFFEVTVNLRGVFLGKQYSALCINGQFIKLYIVGEVI